LRGGRAARREERGSPQLHSLMSAPVARSSAAELRPEPPTSPASAPPRGEDEEYALVTRGSKWAEGGLVDDPACGHVGP
jgi:hypothetical protein